MDLSRRRFLEAVGAASLAGTSVDAQTQKEPADLVLYNGKIVTVDDAFAVRNAIAVKDGRVVAVGGNELVNRFNAARSIDLHGRAVLPGFNDTHVHLNGQSRRNINLINTKSIAQLKDQIRDKARELGPKEWITGAGWDEYQMTEKRVPVR